MADPNLPLLIQAIYRNEEVNEAEIRALKKAGAGG